MQLAPANEVMKKASEGITQRHTAMVDKMTRSAQIIKDVSSQLSPLLEQIISQTPAKQSTMEGAFNNLTAEDIREALQADVGAAAVDLENVNAVDLLNPQQQSDFLKKLLSRAHEQEALRSKADSRRQSRASSEQRRTPKNQVELRQDMPCAVEQMYIERGMKVEDWKSDTMNK